MNIFYQDNHITQYLGDFRENDLPDECVQMVATSPPYWGLRKYSGEQDLIWGGDNILQCSLCNGIIAVGGKDNELRILREGDTKQNQQGKQENVQPKMLNPFSDEGRQVEYFSEGEQTGKGKSKLEGGHQENRGIHNDTGEESPSCCEGLCDGASVSHGGNDRQVSNERRSGASHQCNQRRQPTGEPTISGSAHTQRAGGMPLLPKDIRNKLACPFCHTEELKQIDCQHEWNMETISAETFARGGHVPDYRYEQPLRSTRPELWQKVTHKRGFCSLCGAWRGAYGLEPTPEMYVQHTVEILREIRRVLRKDGVVFLNLGDSYYASGGAHKPGHANPGLSKSAQRGGVPHGKQPIQSLENVPACGNDGKEFLNWKDCDCACSCHDDERQDLSLSHIARNDRQPDIEPSQSGKKAHDRQHRDSSLVTAASVPHASQESSKPSSSQVSLENPSVRFCSDCLKSHYLASYTSNPLGTLYHIPKLKAKDLCLIPFRVAIAAQEDGWWVRSDIIWSKPNPMPESVTDRPTNSHEYILMFTKSAKYYWDADAVRTGYLQSSIDRADDSQVTTSNPDRPVGFKRTLGTGANLKSVWEFPTQPYPEAHFAVFPEKLPETCIKAASPEVGCCSKCGAPWERITERVDKGWDGSRYGENAVAASGGAKSGGTAQSTLGSSHGQLVGSQQTLGWQPTCKCNADKVPSIVLDPFAGSGTTLWVAKKLGRKAIGFDTSEEYCELNRKRNMQQVMI